MAHFVTYRQSVIERHRCDAPPVPQYPPQMYDLEEGQHAEPWLTELSDYVACAAAPNQLRLAACVTTTVSTDTISGWALPPGTLPGFKACARTLVVALAGEFAESVLEMAHRRPSVTVQSAIDLNDQTSCLSWRANFMDGTKVDVLVPMQLLAAAIAPMGKRRDPALWVPTVFIAGGIIAAGGFHVDEELAGSCMDARRYVRINGRPHTPRPMEPHIRRFVERYGLAPWRFGRYRDDGSRDPDLLLATPWDEAPQ